MNFIFEVTEQDTHLLIAGLGELPAKASMPLIVKLREAATQQIEAARQVLVQAEAQAKEVCGLPVPQAEQVQTVGPEDNE